MRAVWRRRSTYDRLNLYRCPQQSEGMKDNEIKTRFMELRAQGLPLKKIAAEIKVSKTTLINWDRDFKGEIDNLRAVELEAMYRIRPLHP